MVVSSNVLDNGQRTDTPQFLVGVGGWAYLPIRRANKLEVCSKIYDFVELNSTFYKLPAFSAVKRWRATVPNQFEFTVRASRQLTHENHLDPTDKNFELYEKVAGICRELNAPVLHFQFPPSFEVTDEVVAKWKDFMSVVLRGVEGKAGSHDHIPAFAFEIRNAKTRRSTVVRSFFAEYDVIPTVDASRAEPQELGTSGDSKILYTRVFGHGEHTQWSFDSGELSDLKRKVESVPAKKKYVTFHNLTMYEDASRMRSVLRTGRESASTPEQDSLGLESAKRVLASGRYRFPTTKHDLVESHGWKTFDAGPGRKLHVGTLLRYLPGGDKKQYRSVEEVLESLPDVSELSDSPGKQDK